MKILEHELVFPQCDRTIVQEDGTTTVHSYRDARGGLTKRELFAAMALQGAMAEAMALQGAMADGTWVSDSRSHWYEKAATAAVQAADVLIAELAK